MKPKKGTKVVHTKNTRDTKITRSCLVYASGGRVICFIVYASGG